MSAGRRGGGGRRDGDSGSVPPAAARLPRPDPHRPCFQSAAEAARLSASSASSPDSLLCRARIAPSAPCCPLLLLPCAREAGNAAGGAAEGCSRAGPLRAQAAAAVAGVKGCLDCSACREGRGIVQGGQGGGRQPAFTSWRPMRTLECGVRQPWKRGACPLPSVVYSSMHSCSWCLAAA